MKKDPAKFRSEPEKKRVKKGSKKEPPLAIKSALKESEERFRKIFENSPIGMALVAPDFRFFSVNPAWIAMTGYSEEELLTMSFKDITHPEHLEGDLEHIWELVAGKIPVYSAEKRYIRKDGSILWGLLRVTAIRDNTGVFRHFAAQIEDITFRRQAEDALRENENRFRLLFERSPVPYQSLDATGRFLEVNDAWLSTLGYSRDEVIGRWFGDFIDPAFSDVFRTNFPKFKAGGETHVEFKMKRKDQTLILVAFDGKIGYYPDGAFRQTHCVFRDITRESAAEKALGESEAKFRTLFENADDAIFIMNRTVFIDCNKGAERIFRCPRDQIIGCSSTKFSPELQPDGRRSDEKATEKIAAALFGEPQSFEWVHCQADGTRFDAEVRLSRVLLKGEYYLQAFVRDITGRRQAEDALKELNLYNRNLLEVSIDPLVTISPDGKIQDVNLATEMATGLARNDLIGTDFSEYFTEPEKAREGYLRVFLLGKVVDYPLEIRHRDGHILSVLYNAAIYRDMSGNIKGVFAAARDISERKHAEKQRENLIRELEKKNTELDRFTYTVSHDLKSPLIAIQSFLVLLKGDLKTGNTGRVDHDILRIAESAQRLEHLITTLLSLSRSGRSVDTPARIAFADLAREAAGLLEATLQQRGIRLVIPDDLPAVKGDRYRLLQVMTNLFDNAVRFMGDQKDPCIEIGVRDPAGIPVFFVRDNGMGIDPADQSKVFGLFERINPEIPGTGIGLATVKRIIEAHGGEIRVESEGGGKGTTFLFTLPVARDVRTDTHNNG